MYSFIGKTIFLCMCHNPLHICCSNHSFSSIYILSKAEHYQNKCPPKTIIKRNRIASQGSNKLKKLSLYSYKPARLKSTEALEDLKVEIDEIAKRAKNAQDTLKALKNKDVKVAKDEDIPKPKPKISVKEAKDITTNDEFQALLRRNIEEREREEAERDRKWEEAREAARR